MAIKLKALLWFMLAALLASYALLLLRTDSLNIDSNVLSLLPATEADPAVERAFSRFSEQNMRSLVFLVASSDQAAALDATEQLGKLLQSLSWIESAEWKVAADQQQNAGRFYFDHRHHLLNSSDAALLESGNYLAFSDDSISLALAPFSGDLTLLLQQDPFLLSYRTGNPAIAESASQLSSANGYLVASKDELHYVLLRATLAGTPFDQDLQQGLNRTLAEVEAGWVGDVQLLRMGAIFHAAHAYETASREISLIGGCSFLLIVVLLIATFRSPWPIVMVSIALVFGIAAGFVVVRLLFGEVHLMTLVFGSSLIGVAEDYAFHYFVIDDENSGQQRMARILPAISIGLLTSVLGYAVLLLTPFPGLQQMAVFCISGLTGAYLTVVWLFPLVRLHKQNSAGMLNLCRALFAALGGKTARMAFHAMLVVLLVTPIYLHSHGSTADDVRNFQAQNADLLAQQQAMEQVLPIPSGNQFYLVKGDTTEALLAQMEAISPQLDQLVQSKAIGGYLNLADLLPSMQRQAGNHTLLQRLYHSTAAGMLVETGLISAEQLELVRSDFAAQREDYLQPEEWLDSPVGREYSYLWLGADPLQNAQGQYAALVALNGVHQPDLLHDIVIDDEVKAVFIDKVATVNDLLAVYRHNLSILICAAFVVIFAVLLRRYDLRKALLITSSPVIAIAATIAGMALLGEPFSLFSILSLFLIIGIGIDFGIFFAEEDELDPSTLLAVLLSGLTTIFSFGLLSLSATAVIHSFGLSMLIGISITLFLSPVIGHLIVKRTALL